ncbi:MAG: hypothetical protein AAFV45_11840 [Pseudomonadota bacterium]
MDLPLGFLTVALCLVLLCVFAIGREEKRRALTRHVAPDAPRPFGRNTAWLAVRTPHTVSVVERLRLVDPRPANWSGGLRALQDKTSADTAVFVSPPVEGWTFVVGLALPHPMGAAFKDKVMPLVGELGRAYPDVQYFLNYAEYDYFSWQRFRDGRFVRVFAATDEGVVSNKGMPTSEERALGLKLFELRGVRDRHGDAGGELLLHPTEAHVLMLAQVWSLDPTRINAGDSVDATEAGSLGYLGVAPSSWRAELADKSASHAA